MDMMKVLAGTPHNKRGNAGVIVVRTINLVFEDTRALGVEMARAHAANLLITEQVLLPLLLALVEKVAREARVPS
jgi:hypothetical protein